MEKGQVFSVIVGIFLANYMYETRDSYQKGPLNTEIEKFNNLFQLFAEAYRVWDEFLVKSVIKLNMIRTYGLEKFQKMVCAYDTGTCYEDLEGDDAEGERERVYVDQDDKVVFDSDRKKMMEKYLDSMDTPGIEGEFDEEEFCEACEEMAGKDDKLLDKMMEEMARMEEMKKIEEWEKAKEMEEDDDYDDEDDEEEDLLKRREEEKKRVKKIYEKVMEIQNKEEELKEALMEKKDLFHDSFEKDGTKIDLMMGTDLKDITDKLAEMIVEGHMKKKKAQAESKE